MSKFLKNHERPSKMLPNSSKFEQKQFQIDENGSLERFRCQIAPRSAPRTLQERSGTIPVYVRVPFWAHFQPKARFSKLYGCFEAAWSVQRWDVFDFWASFFRLQFLDRFLMDFWTKRFPKWYQKWMPKSLKNLCDFGTCDFLVFAKCVSLKSFFT